MTLLQNPEFRHALPPSGGDDMADFPTRDYSKREIKGAGKLLGQALQYDDDAVQAFNIAHNWRASHAYPMMRERMRLSRYSGALTAGRIKRMDSIRKKLRRSTVRLDQMQDLAGIRAIVADMEAVRAVQAKYSFDLRTSDYITSPKPGGYRSVHLIKPFDEGGAGQTYRGQKVEIQIRTRLQHVWATAVEAIGNMRGEDMKAGEGDPDWLRLLALMSGVIAEREGEQQGPDVPASARHRDAELRDLCHKLGAIGKLETYRAVIRGSENRRGNGFYLVQMNAETGEVSISAQSSFKVGSEQYANTVDGGERHQSILVAVDSIDALRLAYPNYFLDVRLFLDILSEATGHKRTTSIDRLSLDFLSGWMR